MKPHVKLWQNIVYDKFMFTNLRRQLTKWAQCANISLPTKLLTKNIFLDICFPYQMICNHLKIHLVLIKEIFIIFILVNKYHEEWNIQSDFAKECASNFVLKYFIGCKVQIFWEGHNFFSSLPLFIWHYLVASNYKWKKGHIFVAFSEYLNFM